MPRIAAPLLVLSAVACSADRTAGAPSGSGGSVCGNGVVESGEACDAGSANSDTAADTCRTDCTAARCGDGVIDSNDACDDGNGDNGDACPDGAGGSCQPAACGDGFVRADLAPGQIGAEQCDDGSANGDDADCMSTCTPARCGDGFVNSQGPVGLEGCDDGNGTLIDDCPDGPGGSCEPSSCGDGFRNLFGGAPEACDDGNNVPSDGCDSCQVAASCGDGMPDNGEQCDSGGANSDTGDGACRSDCTSARCGDLVVDYTLGEECDDGGNADGDGCSATCAVEVTPSCGNDALEPALGEECDDGGTVGGDGCSASCQLEPVGATCGDANIDALELCDSGDSAGGDDCNPTCNFANIVETFADVRAACPSAGVLAADNGSLYVACNNNGAASGQVLIFDVATCLTSPGSCAPTSIGPMAPIESITTDGRRLWVGAARQIWEIDPAAQSITAVAGSGNTCNTSGSCPGTLTGSCSNGDGDALSVDFADLRGLTYYGGYVYLLDANMQLLRRFDPVARQVVTLAGSAYVCQHQDGYGGAARFESPRYMTTDNSGMLYIADNLGCSIRSFNTRTTYVGTFAGVPGQAPACVYQDGTGTAAGVDRPRGMTSDGTSLYWVEFEQHTVRQGILATGEVTTMVGDLGVSANTNGIGCAGSGTSCPGTVGGNCYGSGFSCPARLASPFSLAFHQRSGSLFVYASGVVRRIR